MKRQKWPTWWEWELEFSPLRRMMEHAGGYRADVVVGRWIIETGHNRKDWEIIVEPDKEQKVLVVVTAYPLEELQ